MFFDSKITLPYETSLILACFYIPYTVDITASFDSFLCCYLLGAFKGFVSVLCCARRVCSFKVGFVFHGWLAGAFVALVHDWCLSMSSGFIWVLSCDGVSCL